MREITASVIEEAVAALCIDTNYTLSRDVSAQLETAYKREKSQLGRRILGQLQENLRIAWEERIPICQDTGMAVVFLEVGQELRITEGLLEEAVCQGVREGYEKGCLRKSVVSDPLLRVNTGDNTPPVIHTRVTAGDRLRVTVAPKGFGSENMSRIFMLKPAQGETGVKEAILTAVKDAGPNACPPVIVGVGIGGTFEKAAVMAKHALTHEGDSPRTWDGCPRPEWVPEMEKELLSTINALGIGPGGLGGQTTALAVHIETAATHIAGLPVAVNICCHVNRHKTVIL